MLELKHVTKTFNPGTINEKVALNNVSLTLTDGAKNYIVDSAYDPVYGARPLKRFMQSKIETLIARKIIAGEIAPESTVTVDYDGEKLICR